MPLDFKCPECQTALRVKEEHAGKKMKCPKCAKAIPIPEKTDEGIVEVEVLQDEPKADDAFAFDELDRAGRVEPVAPVPMKPPKPGPRYMPCPHCGAHEAKKVNWTWWGSFYGPRLFHHVRCLECGGGFNGKTGDTNLIPMMLFIIIPLILIGVLMFVLYLVLKRKGLI
jgi:predicted Zn finger-like uncharacterized protein